MKKLFTLLVVLLLLLPLSAQRNKMGSIASLPFSGTAATQDEKEYFAELFAGELVLAGYTLVSRTAAQALLSAESNFQRSGATEDAAAIGKQLRADYVLAGTIRKILDRYAITAQLIHVESGQVRGSDTRNIQSLSGITPELIKEMTAKLNAQVAGTEYVSNAASISTGLMKEDLKKYKTMKWVGRGMWIGGAALEIIGMSVAFTADYPDRDNYSSYSDYEDVSDRYDSQFMSGMVLVGLGGVSLISGIVIDVVYSGRESKLKRQLTEMGVAFNFSPVVTPDIVGNLQYGAQLSFTYKY